MPLWSGIDAVLCLTLGGKVDNNQKRLVREFKQAVSQYEALNDVEYDAEVFGAAMDRMIEAERKALDSGVSYEELYA